MLYLNQVKLVTKDAKLQMRVGRINACAIGKRRLQRAAGQAIELQRCASGHFGVEFFFMAENCFLPDASCNCNLPTKTRDQGKLENERIVNFAHGRRAARAQNRCDSGPGTPAKYLAMRIRSSRADERSVWAPPSRKVEWNGITGRAPAFRVGRPVTWTERGRSSEQIARAARVVAGVATLCRSGSVLRFRQANRCVPVCRWCARLEPLAWAPACPKQEPRKTMAVARFTDSCWCATE